MATRIIDLDSYIRGKSSLPNEAGCIIWVGKLNHLGRAVFPESIREREGISVMVARYILGCRSSKEKVGMVAMHTCDNPSCINPDHLKWGTQKDNLEDMTKKGRRGRGSKMGSPGESNPRSKISLETVKYIRESKKRGRELAKELGLSDTMISRIKNYHSWKEEV